MIEIFGPHTPRVLEFLVRLPDVAPRDFGTVANAWWDVNDRDRAEAWLEVHRGVTDRERYPILAAASVARHAMLDAASRCRWSDWGFWAAGADTGAAIAAGELIGRHYGTLVSPLATVMPWLVLRGPDLPTRDVLGAARVAAAVLSQGA